MSGEFSHGGSGGGTAATPVRDDLAAAAAGLVCQSIPFSSASAAANVASQGLYGSLVGVRAGDVITNIIVFATSAGTTSAVYAAIYDVSGNRLGVSNDFHASFAIGPNVIPLTSAYTVTTNAAVYFAFNSTWSGQPSIIRGISQGTSTAIGSGARFYVQQTGQASPPATATWAGSGLGALWIAAS